MKINQDKVPSNLDEAVSLLKEALTPVDIDVIKAPKFDAVMLHSNVGMSIRNAWSLWDKNTILPQWFKKTYGVDHADDISGIILDCLCKDIRGEPRRDKELAQEFIQYWEATRNGNGPWTFEKQNGSWHLTTNRK